MNKTQTGFAPKDLTQMNDFMKSNNLVEEEPIKTAKFTQPEIFKSSENNFNISQDHDMISSVMQALTESNKLSVRANDLD